MTRKPATVTADNARQMVALRDVRAGWGRRGYDRKCGHCTLGFDKASQRWTMGAYWHVLDAEGRKTYVPGTRRIASARTSHSIAFEGFDADAMERLNAHWQGFCKANNIAGRG